jgi:hypothetical protein
LEINPEVNGTTVRVFALDRWDRHPDIMASRIHHQEAESLRHSPFCGFRLEAKFEIAHLLLTGHSGTHEHDQDRCRRESRKLR